MTDSAARGFRLSVSTGFTLAMAVMTSGCTSNLDTRGVEPAADPQALTVQASDDACTVSAASAPSSTIRFTITNVGSQINEFYVLAGDGLRIVAEIENIGPGLNRSLVASVPPGRYFTACKPGMTGEGIRNQFEVSDSGGDVGRQGGSQALADEAVRRYQAYVKDQTEQLVVKTDQFLAAYLTNDDTTARNLYPAARLHWERIEPIAESSGDLDPKTDAREADLEPGEYWTGWHRLEKDLWPARAKSYTQLGAAGRKTYAEDLRGNIVALSQRVRTVIFSPDQIANGSQALLDEVAKGKVTGEEEYWSRTDLWDFQGNLDGARVGFEGLRPLAERGETQLADQIAARFAGLQPLLDSHRSGDGFVSNDELSSDDVHALSDAGNSLAEPLSRLASAVV